MVEEAASDLHLKAGSEPILRVDGDLVLQSHLAALSPETTLEYFEQLTTASQRSAFARDKELNMAYTVGGLGRFRVNVMRERGSVNLAVRAMPLGQPSVDDLELPQILKELIQKRDGLVLITGPTGSGKSTTLAAMLRHLNEVQRRNVVTIEDPIEFVYRDGLCIIAQRDVGDDTHSFHGALVQALRHDPDVIVIGEMRDMETISTALKAAETGHLVLGTLHTRDATQTVNRVVDAFPHSHHHNVRLQLAQVIEAVVSQSLVRRVGKGRVAAVEIMLATSAVRNIIRGEKLQELHDVMHSGGSEGMQTMDQALARLVGAGTVTLEEAMLRTTDQRRFGELIRGTAVAFSDKRLRVYAAAGRPDEGLP
jgi:twitching motility protein PilT